jgi:hypothetical protein
MPLIQWSADKTSLEEKLVNPGGRAACVRSLAGIAGLNLAASIVFVFYECGVLNR